jgi:hypothetical protein
MLGIKAAVQLFCLEVSLTTITQASPNISSDSVILQAPSKMFIEDQRFIHEDLERLEQGISDRLAEDPRNVSTSHSRF